MPVAFVADNTGSFVWNVPATFSDSCLIKVGDYTNPSWYAVNSGIVSINPGLPLLLLTEIMELNNGEHVHKPLLYGLPVAAPAVIILSIR